MRGSRAVGRVVVVIVVVLRFGITGRQMVRLRSGGLVLPLPLPLAVSICQRGWIRKASMQRRIRKWAKAIVRRIKRMKRAWKAVGIVAERARARSGGVAVSVSVSESVSESVA